MLAKLKFIDLQFALFAALACLSLPVAVFGGLALAFFCGAGALLALLGAHFFKVKLLFTGNKKFITIALMGLVIWSLITLEWTLNEKAAFSVWIRVAALIISSGFMLLFAESLKVHRNRHLLGRWLTYSFILALILAFFEYASDGAIIRTLQAHILGNKDYIPKMSNMNRGACYISLMFWGMAAHWYDRRKKFLLILGLATLLVLTRLASLSAVVGFLVAAIVFIIVRRYGKMRFDLGLSGIIILIAGVFPALNLYTNPPAIGEMHILPLSSLHRLYIWQFAMDKIMEKPLLGWGFDSSPYIPGGNDFVVGRYQDYWRYLPLHTHNNVIQVWLELGALGPLLLVAIFSAMLATIRKSAFSPTVKAALVALVMGYFTIGMTGFGIWQFWWLGAGFLSAAILLAVAYDDDLPHKDSSATANLQNSSRVSSSGRA